MTLTKAHLTDSVHKGLGFPKSKSLELIETLLEIMKTTLESGEDVLISGFGKFSIKHRNDRRGRNSSAGEEIMNAGRRVSFKCSSPLKRKLNGKDAPKQPANR